MRLSLLCVLIAAGLLAAQSPPPGPAAVSEARREAERAFHDGQRFQREGKAREAFDAYSRAAELEPADARYRISREFARQHAAFRHANAGVRLVERKFFAEALKELEEAHNLDPSNQFVVQELQRVRQGLGIATPAANQAGVPVSAAAAADPLAAQAVPANPAPAEPAPVPETAVTGASPAPDELETGVLALRPRPDRRSWDLRGDVRALYLAVGAAYGITFIFDDELQPVPARLVLEEVDFATAVHVLAAITKTFVAPVSERQAIVAPDTTQKRGAYERVVVKQLSAEGLVAPEQVTEVANVLRAVLEMRFVTPNLARRIITVRDTPGRVQAAEAIVESLVAGRPEVVLHLQTLEVSRRFAREMGLLVQPQTTLFKLSPLGTVQTGIQTPLTEVFGRAVTGITAPADAELPKGLAAFGGGRTHFGITIPSVEFRATLTESLARGISTSTVRATDSQPATFLIGSRYPIVNASFSPILFSGAIVDQQNQGTLIQPFPSFTFEDIGIKLRVTPKVHADNSVTLKVEAQVRALTGQNLNGVPTLANRDTDQFVRVEDGQPTIISGMLTDEDRSSLTGTPFLAEAPVLGYLFGVRSKQEVDSEVILVLTAHIVRPALGGATAGFSVPRTFIPIAVD